MTFSKLMVCMTALGLVCGSNAAHANDAAPAGRSIAYAINDIKWGIYETKDTKEECPDGLAVMGPREQFKALYPQDGTKKWKLAETWLEREMSVWAPNLEPDPFPFREAGGKIAYGLDLDGKTKPTDFTSPDGKTGIDNQLFRVIGCVSNYRTGASLLQFESIFQKKMNVDRIMIELTDVDSLANDDDVTITTYRGRDSLLMDGTGNNFQPGGTQRIDMRFGKEFIFTAKAKIVNGVLITQPMNFKMPHEVNTEEAAYDWLRDARFELKLTPTGAEGLIGGYADVESFHRSRFRTWSTHHSSYGQQAGGSVYKVLRKLADGFPDPATGENTAISAVYRVKMVQVRVLRPEKEVASTDAASRAKQLADDGATAK